MKATTFSAAALALLLTAWQSELQAQDNIWNGGATGNFTDDTWTQGGPPLPLFDERGIIGSNVGSGTPIAAVSVTSDIRASDPSSSLLLGDGGGTSGTLNITSTGALSVVNQDVSTGDLEVGLFGGIGVLNIASGGVLEIDGQISSGTSGNSTSTISLAGTASLSAASGFLDRRLEVLGSNVNVSIDGNLILGGGGNHFWRIPSTGASTLSVGGNVDLGGTLRLEFPDGAPSVGDTWNLVDSATVDAFDAVPTGFNFVDDSAVPGLGPGAKFRVRPVADSGSTNGVYSQLVLEQQPLLTIDRDSGAVMLSNPGSAATVAFDVYTIGSQLGALNPNNWNSIAPANGWQEANASNTALSELNPNSSQSIPGNSAINLGQVFNPPTPTSFGQENEDITFRFAVPGGGFINGDIVYTGLPNNTLTLNVDPATGQAQLVNGTNFTVSIDTYTISSDSGSLRFADGSPANTWNSLEDQGTSGGNWFEANESASQIAELLIDGGLELAPNATVDIGSPYNDATGTQDLTFQFSILASSQGDFNADGVVDAADYTVWRDSLGAANDAPLNGNGDGVAGVTAADFAVWKGNFGATTGAAGPQLLTGKVLYSALVSPGAGSLTAPSNVPEPSTVALAAIGLVIAAGVRRRI